MIERYTIKFGPAVSQKELEKAVWSKISNALKGLGFRSHNFLAQLLSETHMVKIFDRFEKAQLAPRTR